MRAIRKFVTALAVAALTAGGLVSAASVAQAYGGDGSMDVYQIGVSFNCNNKSVCGADNLGGFWGWAELDHDPATNTNTGDAQFTGCSHGTFTGAEHTSVDVTNWWVASGSAGPNTLFTDEIDTTTFRGQTDVQTFHAMDTGVNLVPGHQSGTDMFGIKPPPGVSMQIQIAFKPAH